MKGGGGCCCMEILMNYGACIGWRVGGYARWEICINRGWEGREIRLDHFYFYFFYTSSVVSLLRSSYSRCKRSDEVFS